MSKQIDRGFDGNYDHHQHPGPTYLNPSTFSQIVEYFNTHPDFNEILNQVALGDPWLWSTGFVKLAANLLPPAQLDRLVSRYTHTSQQYEEMLPEERRALAQALLTRFSNILRHPQGGQSEEQQGGQGGGGQQSPRASQPRPTPRSIPPVPSPSRPTSTSGGQNTPRDAPHLPPERPPESTPPPPEPTKWDDLSDEEQRDLSEQIKNGQIKSHFGPPPPGAKPFDASSLPQDLQDQLKEQFKEDLLEAAKAMQQALHQHQEGQKLLDQLRKEEELERSQGTSGTGEPEEGEETGGQEAGDEPLEYPEVEEHTTANELTGIAAVEMAKGGHGGGGAAMNLYIPVRSYTERMFSIVREQFQRLAAEPDPSDREDEGDEVWNARKVVKSYWRPDLYPLAKQNLARAPENIYFVLDTSGSMSQFAEVAASLAAGSLGLVHLYHGSEAHPQVRIDRLEPCKSPKDFKGLGHCNSNQEYPEAEGGEKQTFICASSMDGYGEFRREHRGFEGNLEWWLKKEKPPKGSRLIFWGDTYSVSFENVRLLRRLVRDYQFTWLLPYPLSQHLNICRGKTDEEVMNLRQAFSGEYIKLLACGLQVIGGASDPKGLRTALRKLK